MFNNIHLLDRKGGYGLISRVFHWMMAFLIIGQFISAFLRVLAKHTTTSDFFWATHFTLGFTLLILVIMRAA